MSPEPVDHKARAEQLLAYRQRKVSIYPGGGPASDTQARAEVANARQAAVAHSNLYLGEQIEKLVAALTPTPSSEGES